MNVPNYMPEPIEVPGNVATERYATRLSFLRRVIGLYLVSLAAIASATTLPMPHRGVATTTWTLVAFLVILDFIRIRTRGRTEEPWLSCAFFAPVVVLLAALCRELTEVHFPVWALFAGPCCAAIYAALCGRDFSFVGCFFMSLISSTLVIALTILRLNIVGSSPWWAMLANACFLFYWVYDLAALLSRRRLGEEAAAVVDLYRDVFNVFGYVPRVVRHWKKYHIWEPQITHHPKRRDD